MKAADLGVSLPVIPFRRDFNPPHGVCERLSPMIRRVIAPNENAFSFRGTGTYIIGQGDVAVIDPGPLIGSHVEALLEAVKGERVSHILITHTHNDHSPAAAPLKAATGAPTYGFGPHGAGHEEDGAKVEEGGDMDFRPDVTLGDGDVLAGSGWTIEAVHTPGHTSNHLCFTLHEDDALFSGDHVMGWSTTVIVPPDGNMADYMASLNLLLDRDEVLYYPTHGAPIGNPHNFVRLLMEHRDARERQILACLERGLDTIAAMVPVIYSETDKRLHPAASRSVLAHLQWLCDKGAAAQHGPAAFRLV